MGSERTEARRQADYEQATRANKLRKWLKDEIALVESDERFHYKPALVQVNAPLALIQIQLKTRHMALTECLKRLDL